MPDGRPWPRMSIVTPSYNQGQFIEETIRSVLLQSYPDLEYIVIDGGSTDESVEIIKKYVEWLAFWVSEPDRGQSDAINKGLTISKGDFLAYLNSDDAYRPGAFQVVAQHFNADPRLILLYGDSHTMNQYGRTTQTPRSRDFDLLDLLYANYIPQTSTFFRREVLSSVGLFDVENHFGMDYDYWLRVAASYPDRIRYIPRLLAQCRMHPSTKMMASRREFIPETHRIMEKFFARPDLPHVIADRRAFLCSRSLVSVAELYFGELRLQEARTVLWKSLRKFPVILVRSKAIPLLLKSLLGRRLLGAMRNLRSRTVHG